jgi:hypothetical protein
VPKGDQVVVTQVYPTTQPPSTPLANAQGALILEVLRGDSSDGELYRHRGR